LQHDWYTANVSKRYFTISAANETLAELDNLPVNIKVIFEL